MARFFEAASWTLALFGSFVHFRHLGVIGDDPEFVVTPPGVPTNAYVLENGTDYYVAEDGSTYYVQE